MSYSLRDYQQRAVDAGVAFLRTTTKHGKPPTHGLIVIPTGGGKSLVIANTVARLDAPTLVFQPSKEVLKQNAEKFLSYGYEPAVFSASMHEKRVGHITLATIQSVKDASLFAGVRYIIVDEAHAVNPKGGLYTALFAALPQAKILGCTATPWRLHADSAGSIQKFLTRTRPKVFKEVVHYTQVRELLASGHLASLHYQPVPGFNRAALETNSSGGDYTDESIRRHYNTTGFDGRLVRVARRLLEVGRKHILVFTRYVEDAEQLARAFPGQAAAVSGETPDWARDEILSDFKGGRIPIVSNVGILGLGFDFPALDTVVLARPTLSLGLFYQQVGRAIRPHASKAEAWVVDMVDNLGLFGKIEDFVLQPAGKSGEKWEVVGRVDGQAMPLTNRYFGEPKKLGPAPPWANPRRRWPRR